MNYFEINNRFSEDRKKSYELDSDHNFSLKLLLLLLLLRLLLLLFFIIFFFFFFFLRKYPCHKDIVKCDMSEHFKL